MKITPPFGMIVGLVMPLILFPCLYNLATNKLSIVSNFWEDNYGWRSLIRRNLEEEELEDCLALMNLVSIINPTSSRDKWSWNLDKNGNFSFKYTMDLDTKDATIVLSMLV
ncbi:retrotransposon protein, putative, unclassified [Cucumis melo var. makuwa]|uniref:Retrotransposon protein, putative, unclassified n=1 Tax=Cucumis melo var. makuwa TaxID=1194695 RepID=A0A5A7UVQ5_CUCMM|nr:retrotransposon protein, putative, unclassified [Cucumis melo var. makuwa]